VTHPPEQDVHQPPEDDPARPGPGEPFGGPPTGDPGPASGAGGGAGSDGAAAGLLAAVREVALVLAIALGLSLLIKTFFVQAFFIPSESMQTVLEPGDRVLVNKLVPGPLSLHRGDVVVFADPGKWLGEQPPVQRGALRTAVNDTLTFVGLLPSDSGEHLIKRVIGLPGDTVTCCDSSGRLVVNGKPVDEPYVFPGNRPSDVDFTVTVPAGRIWVMGDHRSLSEDSRYHRDDHDGTVPVDNVVGKAFVVVWPVSRWHLVHGAGSSFAGVPAPK
jgi:signal peptidase I